MTIPISAVGFAVLSFRRLTESGAALCHSGRIVSQNSQRQIVVYCVEQPGHRTASPREHERCAEECESGGGHCTENLYAKVLRGTAHWNITEDLVIRITFLSH